MKYWTIVFPGEAGQHVQETWSEQQILSSAWYRHWVLKVVESGKSHLIEDQRIALDDWICVHWAVETDQFGKELV